MGISMKMDPAYLRAWRAANPEKAKAHARKYYLKNRVKKNADSVAWQQANREHVLEGRRRRAVANREQLRAADKAWRDANPDKTRARWLNWYAPNGKVKPAQVAQVFAMSDGVCSYCLQPCGALAVDHVQAVSRGGTNALDNLVMACKPCNSAKRNKTPLEFLCGYPRLGV